MTDPTIDTVAAEGMQARAAIAARERYAIGLAKLRELHAQIHEARAAEDTIASEQKALDDALAAREKALAAAEAAVAAAEAALMKTRANEMLSVYTEESEKRQREAALTRAAHAVGEAQEAAAAAERLRAAELPILEAKRREAAGKVTELHKLAEAVQTAIAEAHEQHGEDVLGELRGRHSELLAARAEALASFKATTDALHDFYDLQRPTALANWPDLAARTLEEQIGHPLTAAREVVEAWLLWIDALDARHGAGDGAALPRYNTVDIIRLLSYMTEDDIKALLYEQRGLRRKEAFLLDLRQTAVRVLERLG